MATRRIGGTNDLAALADPPGIGRGRRSPLRVRRPGGMAGADDGRVRFSDGRIASQATRLDLLLVDPQDRTPIVGEVKVRNDQHPFYALLQLLMLAAQLAPPMQRERLREWYPERFDEREERLDLLMLLSDNPARGRYRPRLLEIADELSRRLLVYPVVAERIRRIACVDARLEGDRLSFEPRFLHPG